jgi:nitronate monooxygenase
LFAFLVAYRLTTVRSSVFDISRRLPWPAPFTGRALRHAHADYWLGREIDLLQQIEMEVARYAAGDFDIAVVHAGETVDLIMDMPPAAIVNAVVPPERLSDPNSRVSKPGGG